MPRRKSKEPLESVDQYLALIFIGVVAYFLLNSPYFNDFLLLLLGAAGFLIGLATLNKGKKNIVNLKTDITVIAFLVVVAFFLGWLFWTTWDYTILILLVLCILMIAQLYR